MSRRIALSLAVIAALMAGLVVAREWSPLPPASGTLPEPPKATRIVAVGSPFWGSSYQIVSERKTVIIADPAMMGGKSPPADIITVSHHHFDHYDPAYVGASSARTSIATPEVFQVKDVRVSGIATNHAGFFHLWGENEIDPSNPSNTIYLYEVDGLRIAHLGDLGQSKLTDEQMAALGKIDVAIAKLNNAMVTFFCGSEYKRPLRILRQLDPKVVIPTHTTNLCLRQYAAASGRDLIVKAGSLVTSRAEIDAAPRRLIFIERNPER